MKTYKIKVNGKLYMVEVEEVTGWESAGSAAPPAQVAPAPQAGAGDVRIEAPMQGLIMSVKTAVGSAVKKGQVLAILEAMKLENEIVAPVDGTVVSVAVKDGEAVDSGVLLLTLASE